MRKLCPQPQGREEMKGWPNVDKTGFSSKFFPKMQAGQLVKDNYNYICENVILYIIHPDLRDSTVHSLLISDYKLKMKK